MARYLKGKLLYLLSELRVACLFQIMPMKYSQIIAICHNAQNQVLYSEELRNRSVNNAEKLTSDFYAFPISGMPHKKSYTHAAQSIHIREIA